MFEQHYEAQRLTVYDTKVITPGMTRAIFDFGASVDGEDTEHLYNIKEPILVERMVRQSGAALEILLRSVGIDYPRCWIMLNAPKERLIKNWKYDKPGDVDLICGNIQDGRAVLDNLIGIQVKKARVKPFRESLTFPSDTGTDQAHYTALMGFDRTLLLHLLVREPRPVPEGYAASWNPIHNSDFLPAFRASYGAIKTRLRRDLFGYGWIGWGQAYGKPFESCGGFAYDVICEPPPRPLVDDGRVRKSRECLIASLRSLLSDNKVLATPQVLNLLAWKP
jgi:hypothetical protein